MAKDEPKKRRGRPKEYADTDRGAPTLSTRLSPWAMGWISARPESYRTLIEGWILAEILKEQKSREG